MLHKKNIKNKVYYKYFDFCDLCHYFCVAFSLSCIT